MRSTPTAGLLVVLAAATALSAGDLPDLVKRGSIRIIAAADEDPMMFSFAAGTSPGFEREMAEGFAMLHKLKLDPVAAKTYDDRIPTLTRGDGDVIIGIIETEERRKLVAFTVEVLPARHVVVSRAPKVIKTVEEFKAEKVGLLKGTTWAKVAIEAGLPAAAAEMFGDRDQMLQALVAGRITATVMSVSDAALAIKKHPELRAGVTVGPPTRASWAIRKEDTKLKAALDEYIDHSRKSGGWNRLVIKYFGEQALSVLGKEK